MRQKQTVVRRFVNKDIYATAEEPCDENDVLDSSSNQNDSVNGYENLFNQDACRNGKVMTLMPEDADDTISDKVLTEHQSLISKIKCTGCSNTINPQVDSVDFHPVLRVAFCRRCFRKFKASSRQNDTLDDKGKYCFWCGCYGRLYDCDRCSYSFCTKCLKGNLGRGYISTVEDLKSTSSWTCVACDDVPLHGLQSDCTQACFVASNNKHSPSEGRTYQCSDHTGSRSSSPASDMSSHNVRCAKRKRLCPNYRGNKSYSPSNHLARSNTAVSVNNTNCAKLSLLSSLAAIVGQANNQRLVDNEINTTGTNQYKKFDQSVLLKDLMAIQADEVPHAIQAVIDSASAMANDMKRLGSELFKNNGNVQPAHIESFQRIFLFHYFDRLGCLKDRIFEKKLQFSKNSGRRTGHYTVAVPITLQSPWNSQQQNTSMKSVFGTQARPVAVSTVLTGTTKLNADRIHVSNKTYSDHAAIPTAQMNNSQESRREQSAAQVYSDGVTNGFPASQSAGVTATSRLYTDATMKNSITIDLTEDD